MGDPEESRETQALRQAQADSLFETLVPQREYEGEAAADRRSDQYRAVMNALLSEEVSRLLGDEYEVKLEENYFYLARRRKLTSDNDFDAMKYLAVMADSTMDLPSGSVAVNYDVLAAAKEFDGWDQRNFVVPLHENVSFEVKASPAVVEAAYARLEKEFAAQQAEYMKQRQAFQALAAWSAEVSGKKLGEADWEQQPMLEVLWPWAKGADCKLSYREDEGRAPELQLITFRGDAVSDILSEKMPEEPKRWFEPPLPGEVQPSAV